MATSGIMLNKKQIEYLIYGFIQGANNGFPVDLTKLCIIFYDDIIHWKIADNDLNKFYSTLEKTVMQGPLFEIQNIPFRLDVFPNGCNSDTIGNVILAINCLKDEWLKNIESVYIYYTLYQYDMYYQWRGKLLLNKRTSTRIIIWSRSFVVRR